MNYTFFINGEFKYYTEKKYKVFDPADGSVIAEIPDANEADVTNAVAAAKEAYYNGWRDFDRDKKVRLFIRWAEILDKRGEEITRMLGRENGFGFKAMVGGGIDGGIVRYYAGLIDKNYGDVLHTRDEVLNYVVREPYGVVAVQTSFNLGASGALHKMTPAMAAGNTVVVRCSEEAPLSTLMLGETIQEAGFPKGVANIISGWGPLSGKALVEHPDVRLITFTGSPAVGKSIMETAAKSLKRIVLELGGKSPLIIFADADLNKAALTAIKCGYVTQGQQCCACSRVLVERSVLEKVKKIMVKEVKQYKPAYPDEDGDSPQIGPLINQKALDTTEKYVALGKRDGKLLYGGSRYAEGKFTKAFYYKPTLFEFEDDSSPVSKEEIFGPVISIIPFDKEDEAIRIANNIPYGLSASVWSLDHSRLNRVIRQLEAGTVWANGYMQFSTHSPWGGYKESGIGREFGLYGLNEFYQYKNIWMNA
jgi:acyl-CoA reductase-like NAD-dependent aldehyde dehydrogenase